MNKDTESVHQFLGTYLDFLPVLPFCLIRPRGVKSAADVSNSRLPPLPHRWNAAAATDAKGLQVT